MRIEPKEPANLPTSQKSLGELFGDLSTQISALVRQEVQLAKTEITGKIAALAIGAAFLAVAAVMGLGAFLVILAAAVAALSLILPVWAAALIVAVVLLIVAGVAALMGIGSIKKATPPVPEKTIATLKEDAQWLKNQVK